MVALANEWRARAHGVGVREKNKMGQLRGEFLHFVKTNGRTMQWGSMVKRTLRRSLRPSWSRSSWPWAGPARYRSNQAGWSKGTYVGGRPMAIVSGCARWRLFGRWPVPDACRACGKRTAAGRAQQAHAGCTRLPQRKRKQDAAVQAGGARARTTAT